MGQQYKHWDLVAESLNKLTPRQLVAAESLFWEPSFRKSGEVKCQKLSGDGSDSAQGGTGSETFERRYRAFKVLVSSYRCSGVTKLKTKGEFKMAHEAGSHKAGIRRFHQPSHCVQLSLGDGLGVSQYGCLNSSAIDMYYRECSPRY